MGGTLVSPVSGSGDPRLGGFFQCSWPFGQDDHDAVHVWPQLGVGLDAEQAKTNAHFYLLHHGRGFQRRI